MKKLLYLLSLVCSFSLVNANFFIDDTKTEFDLGLYYNTSWNTTYSHVQLNYTYDWGAYESNIFYTGNYSNWYNLSWYGSQDYTGLYAVDPSEDIYKSIDQGVTWSEVNTGFSGVASDAIEIVSDSRGVLYIVDSTGDVYNSTDYGYTWNLVYDDYNGVEGQTATVMLVDCNLDYLYIFEADEDLWRSNDSGFTWTKIATNIDGSTEGGNVVGAGCNSSGAIFVVTATHNDVYESTDGGFTWIEISTDYGGATAEDMIIDKANNFIIADGTDIWYSSTGYGTWTLRVSGYGGGTVTDMAFDIYGNLFIVDAGEDIWKSNDTGYTWSLIATDINGIDGDIISLASYCFDTVKFQVRSDDNNDSWSDFLGPDGTNNTYYTNEEMEYLNITDYPYFQYKVYFRRILDQDFDVKPLLNNVTIGYELLQLYIDNYNESLVYGNTLYVHVIDEIGDSVYNATVHYYMQDEVYMSVNTDVNGYATLLVENIGLWYINATKNNYFGSQTVNVSIGHNFVYDNIYDYNGDAEGTYREFGSPTQNYPINWSGYYPDGDIMFQQGPRQSYNSTYSLFGNYSINLTCPDVINTWAGGAGLYVETNRTYLLSGWIIQHNPYNQNYYGGGGHGFHSHYTLWNSSVDETQFVYILSTTDARNNISGQGWVYYEETVTIPESIGDYGFLWYVTYWWLTNGSSGFDGMWISDITGQLNRTYYFDAGLNNTLNRVWIEDSNSSILSSTGNSVSVVRNSGTVYNPKTIDYRPNPSQNDSYVSNGNWTFTTNHFVALKILYTDGSYEYVALLEGDTNIVRSGNVTGFLFNDTTPEIVLKNSTHTVENASEGIYINLGEIEVNAETITSTLQILTSLPSSILNVTVYNFDSDIVSIIPSTNYTLTEMNFTIVVRPSQYYDSPVSRWINFTSNNGDESNFYVYMRFTSSTPILRIHSNMLPSDSDIWTENNTYQFQTAWWVSENWEPGIVGDNAPVYGEQWTDSSSTEGRVFVPDSYASSLNVMNYEYVGFWFKLDMSDVAWNQKSRVYWYFTDPGYNVIEEWIDYFNQELSGLERNEWRYVELDWNPSVYGDEWDRIRLYLQFVGSCDGWYNITLDGFHFYNKSLDFGSTQIDTTSEQLSFYLKNEGSVNPLFLTNITLDSNFNLESPLTEWVSRESNRDWTEVSISSSGKYQTALVNNGYIYVSSDYGVTWTAKNTGIIRNWFDVALSYDGKYQTAVPYGGQIYISSDYGNNWTNVSVSQTWTGVDLSLTGMYQSATGYGGRIYISSDYGNTWTAKEGYRNWYDIAVSSTGKYQTAVGFFEQIYISSDYGDTWIAKQSSRRWFNVDMSNNGQYQTAIDYSGAIYISSDYGHNWTSKASSRNWNTVAVSSTGQYQTAGVIPGSLYFSSDYGHNWTAIENSDGKDWEGVEMSSCGMFQTAVDAGGKIYTYSLYGVRILPNSYQTMNFSTLPQIYTDYGLSYNASPLWIIDDSYGSISQDTSYLYFDSLRPNLTLKTCANLSNGDFSQVLSGWTTQGSGFTIAVNDWIDFGSPPYTLLSYLDYHKQTLQMYTPSSGRPAGSYGNLSQIIYTPDYNSELYLRAIMRADMVEAYGNDINKTDFLVYITVNGIRHLIFNSTNGDYANYDSGFSTGIENWEGFTFEDVFYWIDFNYDISDIVVDNDSFTVEFVALVNANLFGQYLVFLDDIVVYSDIDPNYINFSDRQLHTTTPIQYIYAENPTDLNNFTLYGMGSLNDFTYKSTGNYTFRPKEYFLLNFTARPSYYYDTWHEEVLYPLIDMPFDYVAYENGTLSVKSSTPIIGIDLIEFDVKVGVNHSETVYIYELSGVNNLTLINFSLNNSLFILEHSFPTYLSPGGSTSVTIYFQPDMYYDVGIIGNLTLNASIEFGSFVSNSTAIIGKSTSPEYTIDPLFNFMLESSNGTYAWVDYIGWSNPENFFDDNWTTYTSVNQGQAEYFYVNHTKPEGAIRDNSFWQVKWNGLITNISNLSIPQTAWDYSDTLMLRIYVTGIFIPVYIGIIDFQVFNGTDWDRLYAISYQDDVTLLYEESMFWNVSQFVPSDEYYFGNLQVDVQHNITYRVTHTGDSPNDLQIFSVYDIEVPYDFFNTHLAEGNATILEPGNSTYYFASFQLAYYYDNNYSARIYFTVNKSLGEIDNSTTTYFRIMSSRPYLSYSKPTIFFGDIPVDIESSLEFLNITNYGSPNNLTINYLSSLDSNFKLYNESFPYTILPNSHLEMYFSTIPHRYELYNSSIFWNVQSIYGFISYDAGYLAYNSPTPSYDIEYVNLTEDYLGNLQVDVSYTSYFNIFKTDLGPNQIDFWKHLNLYDPLGYVSDSFDISEIDPTLVGAFDTSNAIGVFVKDDLCYVAEGGSGMRIYNISDIRNVQYISTFDPYSGFFSGAQNIQVVGDIAYVSGLGRGISTVDVSDPYNPVELDNYILGELSINFVVHDGLMYYGGAGYAFRIFNVTDPTNITLLSIYNYSIETAGLWAHYDAFYDNGICWITVDNLTEELEFTYTGKLIALNVTDPYNISYLGEFEEQIALAEVIVHEDLAYVSGGAVETLYILNVSKFDNITLVNKFNEGTNYTAFDLDTDNLLLYVVDEGEHAFEDDLYEKIVVINVSDPYNPYELKILRLEDEGQRVHINNDYIYVTDGYTGIKIYHKYGVVTVNATINATIPFSVRLGQYFDQNYNFSIALFPVNAHRGTINESAYLNFSAMSNTPTYVIRYNTNESSYGYYSEGLIDTFYNGSFFVVKTDGGVNNLTFDFPLITDNESMYDYFSANTGDNENYIINFTSSPKDGFSSETLAVISSTFENSAYDVFVVDTYAFVTTDYSGLVVYDVSFLSEPIFISNVSLSDNPRKLWILDNYAYICVNGSGLDIVDISDVYNMSLVGNVDTSDAFSVHVVGNYAYVADWVDGVHIVNVTDKTNPTIVGTYSNDYITGVYTVGDYCYVVDWLAHGFIILDVSDKTNPTVVGSDYPFVGSPTATSVYGDECFATWDQYGVYVYDVSNKNNPSYKARLFWSGLGFGYRVWTQAIKKDGYIFVCLTNSYASKTAIAIYDANDLAGDVMPIYLIESTGDYPYFSYIQGFSISNDVMFIAGNRNQHLRIRNIYGVLYEYSFNLRSYSDQNYSVEIWLNPDETFGSIDNSSSLNFSISCPTPVLSNISYNYNGSYTDIIPQDILAFNFSFINSNLNNVQAKTFIWTLEDCILTQNFSSIISSQYTYNSTYSIIQVLRDVNEFSQRIQTVKILFYGTNSQNENNLFNITIYPNFTMVDFEYIFPLLTEFTDKEIDTLYTDSDTGDPWRIFNTGSIDFKVVTRIDDYSSSEFSFVEWNYMNGEDTYHEINAYSLYKLTFNNPTGSHQAEFYLNLSVSESCTLRLDINSVIHTRNIYDTTWHIETIYTDDLVDGENEIIFRLYGSSGAKIYLKNASANDNTTFYEFDPFFGYVEQTSSSIGLDIIFCDFILHRRIPKYDSDGLQIDYNDYETWSMSYYPSSYTSLSRVRITFILYDNNSNYLDNFTAFFEFECPRRVLIVSNIEDLDIYVYVGETNAINVRFENIGTTNCKIINMSTDIPWFVPTGYENRELNINIPVNITFITNNLLTSYFADQTYFGTLTLHTTNEGYYSESMYIYVRLRPIFVLVQPIDATRYIEREQDEIVTTSFTIRNDGLGGGYYSVYIIDPNISVDHNFLTYLGTSFFLEPGEEKTIEFQISGDIISDNETFYIQIEQDGVLVSTFTIVVKTTELTKPKSWTWGILLWIIALITLIGALVIRRRFSKKNERDQVEIDKRDEYNFEKERKGYGERKPTTKLQMKQMGRKVLIGVIFGAVLALVLIPIYLWYQGSYEAPWKIGSAIKDQM